MGWEHFDLPTLVSALLNVKISLEQPELSNIIESGDEGAGIINDQSGLQSIVYTVKTSYKDLGLLFSLVFMGMLVFGSLLYYAENGEPDTGFYSIPQVWLS